MPTKAKIEVFESPLSDKVIKTFNTIEDLEKWNETNNIHADRISVNGYLLLGWDELYDFV